MPKIISEQELEEFICTHPEALWDDVEIIGRQVHLRHGILDILAWNGSALVIELKAHALQEKDVGQLSRYNFDVKSELLRIGILDHPSSIDTPKTIRWGLLLKAWNERHGLTMEGVAVQPILIGTSANMSVLAAAEGAGIMVMLWHKDNKNNAFVFEIVRTEYTDYENYPDWCLNLNERIIKACKSEVDETFVDMMYDLFGLKVPKEEVSYE